MTLMSRQERLLSGPQRTSDDSVVTSWVSDVVWSLFTALHSFSSSLSCSQQCTYCALFIRPA